MATLYVFSLAGLLTRIFRRDAGGLRVFEPQTLTSDAAMDNLNLRALFGGFEDPAGWCHEFGDRSFPR